MCTDLSRNVFNFKTKEGTIEKDIKAIKLTETISPAVITKSEKIYKQIQNDDDIHQDYIKSFCDIKKLSYDNDTFAHELCVLTTNKTDLVTKNLEDNDEDETEIEELENKNTELYIQQKEEYEQKLERLKLHENQNLYNYHLKIYNKKYNL